MALVPRARHQAQSVAPAPTVGVQSAQSGAGQLARGFNDVANALESWDDEINTADAKAADAQFSDEVRKVLYEDGNGFMHRMGGNAVRERQSVAELLREKQQQVLSGLSGGARRKAQDAIEGRYQSALQRVDVHASGQRRTFLNDTANARVKAAVNDAIYDPDKVSESIALVVQEAKDAGARNGSSPEVIKGQIIEAQTKIHSGIVKRVAAHSPIDAMRYLQDNKSKMLGTEVAALTGSLAPAIKEYKGRQAGRRAFDASKYSTKTRAVNRPSDSVMNISLDFNAAANPGARGTEVIVPDNAPPEVRKAAARFNQMVVAFAAKHGIKQPNRGVKTRSQNGRGVRNTVHVEPFFNGNIALQKAIDANFDEFASIYNTAFGGLDGVRIIPPHGVGKDRGASSAVFGNETSYGRRIIENILAGRPSGAEAAKEDALETLVDIADPSERAAAIREYKLLSGVRAQQQEAQQTAAADAAFRLIESGGNIDDLPLDFRQNLGREEMTSLRTYQDKVASGEKVETDPELYVSLSKIASEQPDGFVKLNPIAWRDKLDDGDFEKFVDLQRTIRGKGREEAAKKSVIVDAPTISSLRTASTASLKAAGLDTKNNPKTIAAFERELVQWADAFTREGNKKPTPVEINTKINQMLTPVVLNPKGVLGFGKDTRDGPAFALDYDGDPVDPDDDLTLADVRGASIKINGEEVGEELLDRFIGGFSEAMGRNPTAQEVVDGLIESGVFQ